MQLLSVKPLGMKATGEDLKKEKFLFSSSSVKNLPEIFNLFVIGSMGEQKLPKREVY